MNRTCIPYANMNADQLREEIQILLREKDQIETKIEAARIRKKTEGIRPDADWLTRAKFALIERKGRIRAAQELLGLANKAEKTKRIQHSFSAARSFERIFLKKAKTLLPPALYGQLLIETSKSIQEQRAFANPTEDC